MSWNPEFDNFEIDVIEMSSLDGTARQKYLEDMRRGGTITVRGIGTPADPANGDLWIDSTTGVLYMYDSPGWYRVKPPIKETK